MEHTTDVYGGGIRAYRTQGRMDWRILLLCVLALGTLAGGMGVVWHFSQTRPVRLVSESQPPVGWGMSLVSPVESSKAHVPSSIPVAQSLSATPRTEVHSVAERILEGAKKEVAKRTRYQETYEVLDYPMGDVPSEIGVCTDLVVRAFRNAEIDLQKLLHEDRVQNPKKYPLHLWENRKADKNIDHRRCQNLVVFFKRFAQTLDKDAPASWRPGDVIFVIWGKRDYPTHVGIVSDRKDSDGGPMLCHLYPPYCHEAPVAQYGPVYGVYRWPEKKNEEAKL